MNVRLTSDKVKDYLQGRGRGSFYLFILGVCSFPDLEL